MAASIAAGLVLFVPAHATNAGGSGPGGIAYLQGLAGIEKVDVATGARLSPALDLRQQHSIAVSANGRKVFSVSPHKPGVNFGPGELTIIDAATMTIDARVTVGESPLAVAGSPDGRRAYVTSNLDGTLSAVDIQARKVAFTYPVRSPDGVEVSADGGTVYVNVLEGVAALDSRTGAGHVHELPRIVDEYPGALVLSKDGSRLYVATFVANELLTGFVTAIALPQYAVVGRIEVGRWPRGMALAADGGKLYVANGADGTVSVIDAAPLQLAKTIPVGVDPLGVASSFDGATLLVTNNGSANVTFIDAGTDTVVRKVDVPGVTSYGRFIGVAPGIIDAAVEFYHAALDHYFVTQDAAEIAVLEEGTHPG